MSKRIKSERENSRRARREREGDEGDPLPKRNAWAICRRKVAESELPSIRGKQGRSMQKNVENLTENNYETAKKRQGRNCRGLVYKGGKSW
jgi:hypothetical protein